MAEGVAVEKLAQEFKTPVYVYSARSICDRFKSLDFAFRAREHLICYALKANPNAGICRLIQRLGAGAEVVSGGELRRALAAGFDPRKVVFSGVGKTTEEISYALKQRVLCLNVESEEELDAVSRIAHRLKLQAPFSVRLNPDVDAGTHRHITTGRYDTKFGVDAARALRMYRRARRDPQLRTVGIQCHIGSQIMKIGPYREALKKIIGLLERLRTEGTFLKHVDMGGGMGVVYQDEAPLNLEALSKEVLSQLRAWPDLRILLEPGRYLVADSGALLTRVLYRKETPRSRFIVVDAAMNDLLRPALYAAQHPILPARRTRRPYKKMDIVGPVCETSDSFAKDLRLPGPHSGDVLAVLKAGAYGFSMSSQYNSRLRPAEVLVQGNSYRVIRSRESFEDLVKHER